MELAGERWMAIERGVGGDEKRCKNLRKKKPRSSWRERERTST
jgi:Ni,Fe-hydrogenase III component G